MVIDISAIWQARSGLGTGVVIMVILWVYRVLKAYAVETRQEYISRLNETTLDLEREKTRNQELRVELRYLKTSINTDSKAK